MLNIEITKEQWKEDLNFLNHTIISNHLNPFHFVTKKFINNQYQEALKRIEIGSNSECALALTDFAAKFGDGHTYARPYDSFHDLPIYFRWFGDRLHIQDIQVDLKKYQGWEIIKFGAYSPKELLEKASSLVAQGESAGYFKNEAQSILRFIEVLNYLKITNENNFLELTVRGKESQIEIIKICIKQSCDMSNMTKTFKNVPLFYSRMNEPLWFQKIEGTDIGYFNFTSYPSKKEIKEFAKDLNEWIKKETFKTLLIDFRINGGGDGNRGKIILDKIKKTVLSKNINVYVAIGEVTFSAGMGNASDFHKGLKGTFIGKPTGARPNGYQENNSFTLPKSKMSCSYSSDYYTYSENDTPGIFPDIYIESSWEEFYHGEDPLINRIINNKLREN
ncbi:hypothetical protein [Muriicola sp. Z0-33]|uniref:hypothetical protein n=1 Tax=Muriicola sp. Z0-33 TaxID=2816957 RepID=UPI002238D5CE|nr:hypothetical protein [Muriicola sp. Z0-33]MCW5518107.1 hypothetical protein [Muriicola sp. Z0-33]